tara:strand:- start:45673 stop:47850 length:2178 start_codon:yes stop_codon:yes gene_type:complete
MTVLYNGYCRPLKAKVDFEVSEVNSLDTAKGIKWQIKGRHGEHNISVFASETNARDLLTQLDATRVESFDAEIAYIPPEEVMVYESEELVPNFFLGAESFNADGRGSVIVETSIPYEWESNPNPHSYEDKIDNESITERVHEQVEAALDQGSNATGFGHDRFHEIIQVENEDGEMEDEYIDFTYEFGNQLSAEEEDVDYTKMTVKQLKVELKARGLKVSGKKAILLERLKLDIEEGADWENPDRVDYEKDIREQQEIDKGLDAESDFTHAIEDEESFERKFQDDIFDALSFNDWADQEMQTHGEDVSFDEWVDDESTNHGDETFDDWAEHEQESHANRYDAEEAVLTNAEIPPFLYEDYIPPEVWNSISESAKERYIETNDESVLTCPKCGISKQGLRKIEGFCIATEYSSPHYQEGVDCPYSKMFSPIHWISPENEYSEGFEEAVTNRLMTQIEVMGAESPITLHSPSPVVKDTFETGKITISNETYNDIYEDLPESASIGYSKDGRSINIGYFKEDEQYITRLINMNGEIMEEENETMEVYGAEDVMANKSAKRKSFYMNALESMDRMYDAEENDAEDDSDDLGPFSQEAETINQINPTIVEGEENIMGAETLEFHEEELYTLGDEMDDFLKPMIDDLAQQQGYSDFDEFDKDVERRGQLATKDRLHELPLPSSPYRAGNPNPRPLPKVKQESNSKKMIIGLLALGSAAAIFAPSQIRKFMKK